MTRSFDFRQFDAEAFFMKRLKDHGRAIFAGITDADERRERIRYAILDGELDCAIIGKNCAGKPETYAQAFERHYHEPLQPKTTTRGKSCSA